MAWRVAYSLDQLLKQLNALAPNRSRASDGSIGDAAHQAQGSASDHNPWYLGYIVTARDITHDPAGGLDCNKLAAALIAAKDPRVKYLIWQGRLMDSRAVAGNNWRPWTWQPSTGHYQHLHLSVMADASADDTRPWSLPGLSTPEDDVSFSDRLTNAEGYSAPAGELLAAAELKIDQLRRPVPVAGEDRTTDLLTEVSWLPANFRAVNAQLAALVELVAAKQGISLEEFGARVDAAVKKHTPTAEQIAQAQEATLAPVVEAALRRVQDTDNLDEARQTAAELLRLISSAAPTQEAQQ
jgi:hypothetical protein